MDSSAHHHHPHVSRNATPKPAKKAPRLSFEDLATPSPQVVALATRRGTAVAGFPQEGTNTGPDTRWIALFDVDGECLAAAQVEPAETSAFAAQSLLEADQLRHSLAITRMYVSPAFEEFDLLAPLAYLALRRGRILGRMNVVTYLSEAGERVADLLDLRPLPRLRRTSVGTAHCQRLDIAIHRAFTASCSVGQSVVREGFIGEAVETLDAHIRVLLATPYFKAAHDGTLSREQYIYSLSNLHQFVRWTTRLLGRAVSLSDDPELRSHFLNHLSGEVNHEVILESDLAALGPDVDVDYVVHSMVPNLATQEFMVVQESLIGFHEDPVLFMAAPFAAEGFAANVTMEFIKGLTRCMERWGVENPKKALVFFASHVHFDGGDDGHWALTRDILATHLDTDMRLQQFLNAVRLAMNGFIHCYASYVDTLGIWTAEPQSARN